MNFLMGIGTWFGQNILTKPEFFVGLLVFVCYLFLGSYLKFKTSRTHTSDYKPNLKFINSSLKLYKYILEEC